jgi:hypothetical protein
MALTETAEVILSPHPDRLIMTVEGLDPQTARRCANQAVRLAQKNAPKMTGEGAKRMTPVYGIGFFGVRFQDSYMWFQENGIRAFTMNNLQGKTIPMWVDDSDGKIQARNPKVKKRTTASGKQQVLIFRKAAMQGERKTVTRKARRGGGMETVSVPRSYPGAPGRISVRESARPHTTPGRVAGAIARGNSGVRWRHPGLSPRYFVNNGILPIRLYASDAHTKVVGR